MEIEQKTFPEQKTIASKPFPIFYQVQKDEGFWDWVDKNREWFRQQLCTYGALLLR